MKIRIDPQVEKFIQTLEKQTIAKVLRTIDLLETFGHTLTLPHSKKITDKLYELRIRGKQEVRIFYAFYNNSAFLLRGFVKKSRTTPRKEITAALAKLSYLT